LRQRAVQVVAAIEIKVSAEGVDATVEGTVVDVGVGGAIGCGGPAGECPGFGSRIGQEVGGDLGIGGGAEAEEGGAEGKPRNGG